MRGGNGSQKKTAKETMGFVECISSQACNWGLLKAKGTSGSSFTVWYAGPVGVSG